MAALIIVLAVMAGFEVDLREKILGSNAHAVVLSHLGAMSDYEEVAEAAAEVEGVNGVHPFIYTEMMVKSSFGASGVIVKGIQPERVGQVLDLVENMVEGPDGTAKTPEERQSILEGLRGQDEVEGNAGLPGLVIGRELADDLRVFVGDKVHVINPVGSRVGPMGTQVPDVMAFRVQGIFYSGMYEYDTKWTYVHLADAQSLLRLGDAASGVELTVDDVYAVDSLVERLEGRLQGSYDIRHWKDLNANLFNALKLEKIVMGLILSLICGVASLNIAGTLILLVLSKGREIAILRAMGATRRQVRSVFILEGLIIGAVGTIVGTGLGVAGSLALKSYGWPLDTDVYYLDSLPVVMQTHVVGGVAVAAMLICFLATLYPSTRAAALDPVEGLRYE